MKNLFKITIFVAVLVAAVSLEHNFAARSKNTEIPPAQISSGTSQEMIVTLKIDFGNGEVKNYDNIKTEQGKTVFDLLKKVAGENQLELSYKEYPDLGAMVESIGGVKNDFDNNKWWQFWVNNEYSTIGAGNYQLKNGDSVEWKFIKGQF